jgi:hypothetical protein
MQPTKLRRNNAENEVMKGAPVRVRERKGNDQANAPLNYFNGLQPRGPQKTVTPNQFLATPPQLTGPEVQKCEP